VSRFSYFPGCSLHATAREYDQSIRALADMLGLELREIEGWCCCGATPAHALDPQSAEVLGLWNLAHAARTGKDPLLTGCAACFSHLRAAREEVAAHPEAAGARSSSLFGMPVDPAIEVLHIAQVLAGPEVGDRIRAKAGHGLGGLKVACYYGCLLTRPRGPGAVDDAEDPRILEDLARLAGAEPVPFPLRLDCCGASMALPRPDIVRDLSGRILEMARERGARALVVACPLCHSNMDFQQAAIARQKGFDFRLPVLYVTQLVGLALGLSPERLGLNRHFVPVPAAEWAPAQGASVV
jgi:heterodisulfide reductase subunit B